jgi:hypothetical protein
MVEASMPSQRETKSAPLDGFCSQWRSIGTSGGSRIVRRRPGWNPTQGAPEDLTPVTSIRAGNSESPEGRATASSKIDACMRRPDENRHG